MALTSSHRANDPRRNTPLLRRLSVLMAVAALAVIVAMSATSGGDVATDASLPNPMGGPARTAPGTMSGEVELAGLRIADAEVAMGDVALGVTYVPGWEVSNPTGRELAFTAGQPRVLEGCCPGPVYADGQLTQAGQEFTVAPGGSVLLQFPLQMHPGMDGPHHLAIPLEAGDQQSAVQVTGNFTATASAG